MHLHNRIGDQALILGWKPTKKLVDLWPGLDSFLERGAIFPLPRNVPKNLPKTREMQAHKTWNLCLHLALQK